ncbi:MAG: J domain-containing protein [Isosphaeraceae bacterium]
MLEGISLDPYTVLGLTHDATPEQVREAYHQKSKKYHPDAGGDAWAFHIVARAYEFLVGDPARSAAQTSMATDSPDTGRIRSGLVDKDVDPVRLVHVEMLWMRYEVGDVMELLAQRPDERHLSGSLTLTWPPLALADAAALMPESDLILRALNAAFDEARSRPPVTGGRSQIENGRFEALLSYPSGQDAWKAFKVLHVNLKARGLGVKQWTRELTVPRA